MLFVIISQRFYFPCKFVIQIFIFFKKSDNEIPSASHIALKVAIFGSVLRLYKLFNVDWVRPASIARKLMLQPFSFRK